MQGLEPPLPPGMTCKAMLNGLMGQIGSICARDVMTGAWTPSSRLRSRGQGRPGGPSMTACGWDETSHSQRSDLGQTCSSGPSCCPTCWVQRTWPTTWL